MWTDLLQFCEVEVGVIHGVAVLIGNGHSICRDGVDPGVVPVGHDVLLISS